MERADYMTAFGARLSRRQLLRAGTAGIGLSLLAACAPSAVPATPTQKPAAQQPAAPTAGSSVAATPAAPAASIATVTPAQKPAVQPKSGGTLRAAQNGDYLDVEGHRLGGSQGTSYTLWDRLIEYDAQLNPQPRLAESWDVTPDFKQVKFNLRKGVTFHNGREFTSEDVKNNLIRARDPKVGIGQFAPMASWWEAIETPDKNTIILKSAQSRVALFDLFDLLSIVDTESAAAVAQGTASPIGTGPFKWVDRKQGVSVNLTKNKDYWRSGMPYVDELDVRIFTDPQSMVLALEGGSVDVIYNPALPDAARLLKDSRFNVIRNDVGASVTGICFNTKLAPGDNKKLRQAVAYATDRTRFAESSLMGLVEPTSVFFAKHSPAYDANKDKFLTFDLDKAKAAYQESGLSNVELTFLLNQAGGAAERDLAQIMQADLAKIGITVTHKPLELAAYSAEANANGLKTPFLRVSNNNFNNMDPSTMFTFSSNWRPSGNSHGFSDPRYTELVDLMGTEADAAKRKALYDQVNDLLFDQAFNLPVAPTPTFSITASNVKGAYFSMNGMRNYEAMWLDR